MLSKFFVELGAHAAWTRYLAAGERQYFLALIYSVYFICLLKILLAFLYSEKIPEIIHLKKGAFVLLIVSEVFHPIGWLAL